MLPRFCEQTLERSWKARALRPGRAVGRQARHDRPRALSHRSRRQRHPPVRARRRHARDAHARAGVLRGGRDDDAATIWRRIPDPGALRVPAARISRRCRRVTAASTATTFRNFPSFPQRYMEPLHGAAGGVAEGVKVEPLKRAGAAARSTPKAICTCASSPTAPPRRLARSALRRLAYVTRRAPTKRVAQYGALSRSTRTSPRAARRVDELVAADRDAHVRRARRDRGEEHQVARLRARAARPAVPRGYCSLTVRGTATPFCPNT